MGGIGNNNSQTVGTILWDRSVGSEEGMLAFGFGGGAVLVLPKCGHRLFLQQMCSAPAVSTALESGPLRFKAIAATS